jgi:hypothetical protein
LELAALGVEITDCLERMVELDSDFKLYDVDHAETVKNLKILGRGSIFPWQYFSYHWYSWFLLC